MAEAGLRRDHVTSWLITCEAELSQHLERAVPTEGLMFAPLAKAQGEVSFQRLCSACNRSSTCTYHNAKHASNCVEIHFPPFFVVSETHDLATRLKLLVILLRESESRKVCTSEWPWLQARCCPMESIFCRFHEIQRICWHVFFWSWHVHAQWNGIYLPIL